MLQFCLVWSNDDHTHHAIVKRTTRTFQLIYLVVHFVFLSHNNGVLTVCYFFSKMLIAATFEISFVKIAWWVWSSFDHTKQYCSIERMNIFWMADLHSRNLCMYAWWACTGLQSWLIFLLWWKWGLAIAFSCPVRLVHTSSSPLRRKHTRKRGWFEGGICAR